uniref:Ovule protein n=1 Tax=Loa loa TaxID=7209 RepID=A0A1I7VFW1_LOALO
MFVNDGLQEFWKLKGRKGPMNSSHRYVWTHSIFVKLLVDIGLPPYFKISASKRALEHEQHLSKQVQHHRMKIAVRSIVV